jgi:ATP-dependent DNA ligase
MAGWPRSFAGRYEPQDSAAGAARKTRWKSLMGRRAERSADRTGRAVTAHFIAPMNCLAVAKLPAGPAWAYELKLDGYRAIAFKTSDRVHLKSRNGKDFASGIRRRFVPSKRFLTRP